VGRDRNFDFRGEVDNEVLIDCCKIFIAECGDFVTARITDATEFDLYGEVVD